MSNNAAISFPHQEAHRQTPALSTPEAGLFPDDHLPFTLRIVHTEEELAKATAIRYAAYHRHVPDMAQHLREPESYDWEDGTVVMLVEAKIDGEPLGTMRIQTNRFKPLNIEHSVDLPAHLNGKILAQASRLGIGQGRVGRMVKLALFKAFYLYSLQAGIDFMVIAARSPLDRIYDDLLFTDVYPGLGFIPIKHADNMPHRVMGFDVRDAQRLWIANSHPLFKFVVETNHVDIDISDRGLSSFVNPIRAIQPLQTVETTTA
jgi:hypothetical protein